MPVRLLLEIHIGTPEAHGLPLDALFPRPLLVPPNLKPELAHDGRVAPVKKRSHSPSAHAHGLDAGEHEGRGGRGDEEKDLERPLRVGNNDGHNLTDAHAEYILPVDRSQYMTRGDARGQPEGAVRVRLPRYGLVVKRVDLHPLAVARVADLQAQRSGVGDRYLTLDSHASP